MGCKPVGGIIPLIIPFTIPLILRGAMRNSFCLVPKILPGGVEIPLVAVRVEAPPGAVDPDREPAGVVCACSLFSVIWFDPFICLDC
jgi:hypothetical protein